MNNFFHKGFKINFYYVEFLGKKSFLEFLFLKNNACDILNLTINIE